MLAQTAAAASTPLVEEGLQPQIHHVAVVRLPVFGIIHEPQPVVSHPSLAEENWLSGLPKLPKAEEWTSLSCGLGRQVHCFTVSSARLTFVCVADDAMGRKMPFQLLSDLNEEFSARYPMTGMRTAKLDTMNFEEVQEAAQTLMHKHNAPNAERVMALSQKVGQIQEKLNEGMTAVLERQQNVQELVERSEGLSQTANNFKTLAVDINNESWWRLQRMRLAVGVTTGVTVAVLVFAVSN